MTTYVSIVLAIPADQHDQVCAIATGLGWQQQDGDSFNMPASADGSAPATWFFARSQASPGALAIIQATVSKAPEQKAALEAVAVGKGAVVVKGAEPVAVAKEAPTMASVVQTAKADAWPLNAPLSGAWDDYGLTDQDIADVGAALVIDVKTQAELDALGWSYGDHVANVMKAQGVRPIAEKIL